MSAERIELYKEKYGDEPIHIEGNYLQCPPWLAHYILDTCGLKSKKRRLQKKVLKRTVIEALWRGFAQSDL